MDNLIEWWLTRDWPLTFSVIKDVTIIATAFFGIVQGGKTLRQWRQKLTGTTNYELAKKLLISIFQIRNEFARVRSPYMSPGEIVSALKKHQIEYDDILKVHADQSNRAVFFTRFEKLFGIYNSLGVYRLEAEALWDKKLENSFINLERLMKELQVSIELFTQNIAQEDKNKHFWIVFSKSKDDDFEDKVNKLIDEFTQEIKPFLLT